MTFFLSHFPSTVPLPPTDVLDGVRGHHEDDAVDGGRGENEGEERAEEEQLQFGGGGDDDSGDDDDNDDDTGAATSASALVTNPLPLEALLPTTSSTQGPLELTNPSSELTSLGKIHCLRLCGASWLSVFCTFFLLIHSPSWNFNSLMTYSANYLKNVCTE